MEQEAEKGIPLWSSIYMQIIVAMAATLNVKAALSGGPLALLAGAMATFTAFAFIPLLSKIGNKKQTKKEKE